MSNTQQEDYSSIEKKIKWSLRGGGLLILLVFVMYFINFNGDLNTDPDKWGPFGDFIGGTLNPILAALAFYWLTASIRLQIQELRETKIELGKAAKAQADSATHQEQIAKLEADNVKTQAQILELNKATLKSQQEAAIAQQQHIELQNFDNLFFQLLKTKSELIKDINFNLDKITYKHTVFKKVNQKKGEDIFGKEAFHHHLVVFKKRYKGSWGDYYKGNMVNYFENYFRTCSIILNMIGSNYALDNYNEGSMVNNNLKKKQYMSIFKTTLSQFEYETLFFYYISHYSSGSVKRVLENFYFFESFYFNIGEDEDFGAYSYAFNYDETAFGSNSQWAVYFDEYKKLNKNISKKVIIDGFDKLVKIGIIELNNSDNKYYINKLYEGLNIDDIFKNENYNKLLTNEGINFLKINTEIERAKESVKQLEVRVDTVKNKYKEKNEICEDNSIVEFDNFFGNIVINLSEIRKKLEESKNELNKLLEKREDYLNCVEELRGSEVLYMCLFVHKYKAPLDKLLNSI